jgi:hypothetical protein
MLCGVGWGEVRCDGMGRIRISRSAIPCAREWREGGREGGIEDDLPG